MGTYIFACTLNVAFSRIPFLGFFSSFFFQLVSLPSVFVVPYIFHQLMVPQCISGAQLFVSVVGLKLHYLPSSTGYPQTQHSDVH